MFSVRTTGSGGVSLYFIALHFYRVRFSPIWRFLFVGEFRLRIARAHGYPEKLVLSVGLY